MQVICLRLWLIDANEAESGIEKHTSRPVPQSLLLLPTVLDLAIEFVSCDTVAASTEAQCYYYYHPCVLYRGERHEDDPATIQGAP